MNSRLLGALLLIAGGGWAGLGRRRELQRRVRLWERLISSAERLRTEAALLCTPFPQAAECLGKAYPELWGALAEASAPGEPFMERWRRAARELPLPAARELFLSLGEEIGGGGEAARAAEACLARLGELREAALREAEEKGRLSAPLGFCAGGLLAILLA